MPQLPNPKHERFAAHLAAGMMQTKAYIAAGFNNAKSAPSSASVLAAKETIKARVAELKAEIAEEIKKNAVLDKITAMNFFLGLAKMGAEIARDKKDPAAINAAKGAMAEAARLQGLYPEKIPANSIVINSEAEKGKKAENKGPAQVIVQISGNDANL